MPLKWAITSDIETSAVIIEEWNLKAAIEKYLTDWYPGADVIHAIPVRGESSYVG